MLSSIRTSTSSRRVVYSTLKTRVNYMSSLTGKNLMSIEQLTNQELEGLIDHSISIKKSFYTNPDKARALRPLLGQTMSMIFQKVQ